MRHFLSILLLCAVALGVVGCASAPPLPSGRYMRRTDVRVAIVPSMNDTSEVSVPLMVDKTWESSLSGKGFHVINADRVVTYAASTGCNIVDLQNTNAAAVRSLGKDLSADFIIFNHVTKWKTAYRITSATTIVSCYSALYEAKTGAVLWEDHWTYEHGYKAGGNPIADIVGALTYKTLSAMSNAEAGVAAMGVNFTTAASLPVPAYEPNPVD